MTGWFSCVGILFFYKPPHSVLEMPIFSALRTFSALSELICTDIRKMWSSRRRVRFRLGSMKSMDSENRFWLHSGLLQENIRRSKTIVTFLPCTGKSSNVLG